MPGRAGHLARIRISIDLQPPHGSIRFSLLGGVRSSAKASDASRPARGRCDGSDRPRGGGAADSEPPAKRPLWLQPRCKRYLVLVSIGNGSYGRVSMGIDLLTNQREFALMAALVGHPHPSVARMLDYFCTEAKGKQELHTVQALADTTLWHVFRSSAGDLADGRIASYLRGVAAGLGHLHSLGIIHGDASLKNALVMRSDTVAVTDFGSAHSAMGFFLEAGDEVTTQYVRAPERLLGAALSEPCVDVWAFGVQLWCLRTGSCEWIAQECTLSQQLVAVAGAIGPIPAGSSLMSCRLWGTLSCEAWTPSRTPRRLGRSGHRPPSVCSERHWRGSRAPE